MRNTEAGSESKAMHRREITLPDGRYMIFYTFGEENSMTLPVPESESEIPAAESTTPAAEAAAAPCAEGGES